MSAQSVRTYLIAIAVVSFLALGTTAQAQTPTSEGLTATTSGGPTGITGTPVPGSMALLVARGENTPVGLINLLGVARCNVETVGIIQGGVWRMYVNGAPGQVNSGFPLQLPDLTPFFVRCL